MRQKEKGGRKEGRKEGWMRQKGRKRERIRGRIRYNNFYNSFIEDKKGLEGGCRLQCINCQEGRGVGCNVDIARRWGGGQGLR